MKLIKSALLMVVVGVFLMACGGGGGGSSSSSSGFAPVSASAFETKFLNQSITVITTSNLDAVNTILSGARFRQAVSGVTTITIPYVYVNTGANTATSSYTALGINCVQTWTFTSALAGRGNEVCTGSTPSNTNFTFTVSGSN